MRRLLWISAFLLAAQGLAATAPVTYTDQTITPNVTACFNTSSPANQYTIDSSGNSYRCVANKWQRADIPACPANPPTGACAGGTNGTAICKRTDQATLYGCDGSGNWASMSGSGAAPAGTDLQLQVKSGAGFGAVPGTTGNTSSGALDVKILNGVRYANSYASNYTSGGTTVANCWTGWETVFDSNPRKVKMPAGYYCWNTPKTVTPASANDREARFELEGDGQGATIIVVNVSGALKIDGSGTVGAYGAKIHDFTVQLGTNLWYGNGIFDLIRTVNYEVSNILFYGGDKLGSALEINTYAGYLLNLDTSYIGSVRDISSWGRYIYIFEKDDLAIASEDDSIHFDTLFTKGPIMGIVRAHANGVHNLTFSNLKYQTNAELPADTNQYDVTTLNGSHSFGQTSMVVVSSAAFQVGDPVLLDVGNLLELNKVSAVPDGTHITLANPTRFAHASATQVLHGGVGIGLAGTSRLITFKSSMFEQCASGVMTDRTDRLDMQDILSTCAEVVQVVGPASVAGATGLIHGTFNNIETGSIPGNTHYIVRVRSNADTTSVRNLSFNHCEKNGSSGGTLVEFQNDAGTFRSYSIDKPVNNATAYEYYWPTAYNTYLERMVVGGVTKHEWFGTGAYTAAGAITATGGFLGNVTGTASALMSGTTFPSSPAAGDVFVITTASSAGVCDFSAGAAKTLCRWSGSAWQAIGGSGGGGSGTVTGPGSSAVDRIAAWNNTGGTVLKNTLTTVDPVTGAVDVPASVTDGGSFLLHQDTSLGANDWSLDLGQWTGASDFHCTIDAATGKIDSTCLEGTYTNRLTTKGDVMIYASGNETRLPVGTNGQILAADSGVTNGVLWSDAATVTESSPQRGAIMMYGASGWRNLNPGTSGQYLQTQGAGVDASWAAGSAVTAFPNLTDVPDAIYTGNANEVVVINSGETGLDTVPAAKITETSIAIDHTLVYKDSTDGYVNKALPSTGTNGCSGSADKILYNTTTHVWSCGVDAGAVGGGITAVSGDTGTPTDATTISVLGGTNGIDTVASSSTDTVTVNLDLTEVNSATMGSGTFTALTFDAGATDPVFTFGSNSVTVTGAATFNHVDGSIPTVDLAAGTGVATFLTTPSSANLLAALTTSTGTGSAVFSADATLTGNPQVTTSIAARDSDNTIANTAFVDGEIHTTEALGSSTLATGECSFSSAVGSNGGILCEGSAGGGEVAIAITSGASNRTFTMPSSTATLAGIDIANTWTGANTFNTGLTTVTGGLTVTTNPLIITSGVKNNLMLDLDGNGTNDYAFVGDWNADGLLNDTDIEAASVALPSGKKVIELAAGVWNVDVNANRNGDTAGCTGEDPHICLRSGTTLKGQGEGITILRYTGSTTSDTGTVPIIANDVNSGTFCPVATTRTSNIHVSDLTVETTATFGQIDPATCVGAGNPLNCCTGAGAGATCGQTFNPGIRYVDCDDCTVDHVTAKEFAHAGVQFIRGTRNRGSFIRAYHVGNYIHSTETTTGVQPCLYMYSSCGFVAVDNGFNDSSCDSVGGGLMIRGDDGIARPVPLGESSIDFSSGVERIAQTWTMLAAGDYASGGLRPSAIWLWLRSPSATAPTGNIDVAIFSTTAGAPNAVMTGYDYTDWSATIPATGTGYGSASLTDGYRLVRFQRISTAPTPLPLVASADTVYALVVKYSGGVSKVNIQYDSNATDTYTGGSIYTAGSGGSWSAGTTGYDLNFFVENGTQVRPYFRNVAINDIKGFATQAYAGTFLSSIAGTIEGIRASRTGGFILGSNLQPQWSMDTTMSDFSLQDQPAATTSAAVEFGEYGVGSQLSNGSVRGTSRAVEGQCLNFRQWARSASAFNIQFADCNANGIYLTKGLRDIHLRNLVFKGIGGHAILFEQSPLCTSNLLDGISCSQKNVTIQGSQFTDVVGGGIYDNDVDNVQENVIITGNVFNNLGLEWYRHIGTLASGPYVLSNNVVNGWGRRSATTGSGYAVDLYFNPMAINGLSITGNVFKSTNTGEKRGFMINMTGADNWTIANNQVNGTLSEGFPYFFNNNAGKNLGFSNNVPTAESSAAATPAWAANGTSCATACTAIGRGNCVNAICTSGIGATCTAISLSVACSATDQLRMCQCY